MICCATQASMCFSRIRPVHGPDSRPELHEFASHSSQSESFGNVKQEGVGSLPMIDRLIDNRLMESIKYEDAAELIVEESGHRRPNERSQRDAIRKLSARWGTAHKKRVEELVQELLATAPDAQTDEILVFRLAASGTAVAEKVSRAQLQLAERLECLVDQPKLFLALAKSLQMLTVTQNATTRSVQELLSAAATVRAQRRLVDHHAKRTWHADIGGAPQPPTRRGPSMRPETAN
jgi:hypothetical protein